MTAARGPALKRLFSARARVVGALLAKYDARSAGYSYGYGYHYGYGHAATAKPETP